MALSLVLFMAAALLFVYAVHELWPDRGTIVSGMSRQRRMSTRNNPQAAGVVRISGRSANLSVLTAERVQPPAAFIEQEAVVLGVAAMLDPPTMAPFRRPVAERNTALTGGAGLEEVIPGEAPLVPRGTGMGAHREWLVTLGVCIGLFVFAIAVRWWGLPDQNMEMWGDEAQLMSEARKFIDGTYTTPFLIDHLSLPALYDYLLSFPLRFLGVTDVAVARGFSGFLGSLGVPLLYLLSRELGYPRRVGIVAAVALATTFWSVNFSRLVLQNIMTATAAGVAVLFLVMAVRRSNLVYAALAGMGLAWAFNSYLSGTLVILVAAGWLFLLLVWHGRWWERRSPSVAPVYHEGHYHTDHGASGDGRGSPWDRPSPAARRGSASLLRHVALLDGTTPLDLNSSRMRLRIPKVLAIGSLVGLVGLLCSWPLLQLYLQPGNPLALHASQRYILSPANRAIFAAEHPDLGSSTLSILWYQIVYVADLFTVRGDPALIFNLPYRPLLDPLTGFLFLVGVVSTLWAWKRPSATLVLLLLVVPFVVGQVLTTTNMGTTTRALPALPAMCLLISLGLETFLSAFTSLAVIVRRVLRMRTILPAWWTLLRYAVVVVATLVIGVVGVIRYWDFANATVTRNAFYTPVHEWAIFLAPRGAVPVTVVAPAYWPVEYNNLYAPRAMICSAVSGATWQACPPAHIVIFNNDQADADRYASATGLPVTPGASYGMPTLYWYVKNGDQDRPLPDPGHVLGGLH